jgi:hypothetical protein
MDQYEYLIENPRMESGKVITGYQHKLVPKKNIFGNDWGGNKSVVESNKITETEWLNLMGSEGWELVAVDINSFSHDIKRFYFKRLKTIN